MNHFFSDFFHKIFFLLTILSILLLPACQTPTPRQAYEGDAKADNEVAIFTVPSPYNLLSIDGVKFNQYALSKNTAVKVLPGSHQFIVEYQDFWDLGGGEFEKVTSKPMAITFTAQAGVQYTIKVMEFETLEKAQVFAKKPTINVINTSNKQAVSAEFKYNLYGKGLFTTLFGGSQPEPTQQVATTANIEPDTKSDTKDSKALEMLKYWWEKADENQQNDFHRWIKNH